jgi:hypothetical protein
MYQFRARDRRLMEQCARDVALTLQRDYFMFGLIAQGKKSKEISNRQPIYTGYLLTGANAYPNTLWTPGSQVDQAFVALESLLTQLGKGSYQQTLSTTNKNPALWPVQTITWQWIRSLYASLNPAYAAWLTANNITVPPWNTAP